MLHPFQPRRPSGGRLRWDLWGLPLALILLGGAFSPIRGEIFRWTDESGTITFTDNLQSVPPQYRHQVRALDDSLPPTPEGSPIPLEQNALGYVVSARVNRRLPVRLVLDTGATSTVISRDAADTLGLEVRNDRPVIIQTANGTVEAAVARVEEIEVGGQRVGPLDVIIHDAVPGADGLLGMNFLGAFRVEIHGDGPTLMLSRP